MATAASDPDPLNVLARIVRERMERAAGDKALFERHGQRLNSQLMQGELNMGTAVLAWIERQQGQDVPEPELDEEEPA